MRISREQILRRIRVAGWHFKRQGKRVEIWRNPQNKQRLNVPQRKQYTETQVRMVLSKAGLTHAEIEEFLTASIK